jgi:hypothetical protein
MSSLKLSMNWLLIFIPITIVLEHVTNISAIALIFYLSLEIRPYDHKPLLNNTAIFSPILQAAFPG